MQNTKTFSKYTDKQAFSFNDFASEMIPVMYQQTKAGTFEADLYGTIESPAQFSQIISALSLMEEQDQFILHLQSGGGSLDATDALIHAMRKCKGSFHCIATGNCSSAATFILLEADSYELSDGFNSTLHCGSLGSGGAFNEWKQQTKFYNKFMPETLRKYYAGFLTEKEIEDMLNGIDIILNAEEWQDRYELRNEYYKSEVEKIIAKAEEQGLITDGVFDSSLLEEISPKKPAKVIKPPKVAKIVK